MSRRVRNIRGMPDILPDQTPLWHLLEDNARRVLTGYGYREMRLPLLEHTELFRRSLGSVTDIVEKEMYTFEDRNGDSLTLRPEGTAGVVRSMIQHGLLQTPGNKIWYQGPMFRHERPQRGRQRQFHQIGAEAFGIPAPGIDAEMIVMTRRLWQALGIDERITLVINNLGSRAERSEYRDELQAWLRRHAAQLDDDSRRRIDTNPLRVLDSKNPRIRELLLQAPGLSDHLGDATRRHYDQVLEMLAALGVAFEHSDHLVRGLDYYSHTVFEWQTDALGAQGTVCGGGRYEDLVALHGDRPCSGIGFAMGEERLVELIRLAHGDTAPEPLVYLAVAGQELRAGAMVVMEHCRDTAPAAVLLMDHIGGSLKAQMRRADRSMARWVMIYGEEEHRSNSVTLKPLRGDGAQQTVSLDQLPAWLLEHGPL